MKKILRFDAAVAALCFGLMCFVACQDPNKNNSEPPSEDSGTSTDQQPADLPESTDTNPNENNSETSTDQQPAKLPESVGDNPFMSEGNETGVVLTVYTGEVEGYAWGKIEFYADGNATFFHERDNLWRKEYELKYSWNAENNNIYYAYRGCLYNDELLTTADDFVNAELESDKRAYEKYKEEKGDGALSFALWYEEKNKMVLDEYIEYLKDIFNLFMSALHKCSYEKKDGKFVFTEIYTGLASSIETNLGRGIEFRYDYYDTEWLFSLTDIEYERDDGEEAWYYTSACDAKTITYKLFPTYKSKADLLGFPKEVVADYTEDLEDLENRKLTIKYKDSRRNETIENIIIYDNDDLMNFYEW